MHDAARAYNKAHPEPTLHLDVCGYEYATVAPADRFLCCGCDRAGRAVRNRTVKVEVGFDDPAAPLGRRQQRLGIACDEHCAHRAFGIWYWERRQDV